MSQEEFFNSEPAWILARNWDLVRSGQISAHPLPDWITQEQINRFNSLSEDDKEEIVYMDLKSRHPEWKD